ncbi:DnaT-like ssDNA-binding protein [Sulfitobacter pacificus]|uniref:DnaT-like ssDNA-binding protein n=1 Tax=Sulfitobacter pacificus TaxID=1499314 RepID=UPI0031081808
MTLTVEDGTGLVDADAFPSLVAFKAYCDKRGYAYTTDELINQAIVRATAFMSDSFAWDGWRVKGRGAAGGAQALTWPRHNVTDEEGHSVPSDSVPIEVIEATIEIAIIELATPGIMTPSYTPSERVKSEKVGKLAIEYDLSAIGPESARPVLLAVRDKVGAFLATGGGSSISGVAVRG